LFNRFSITLGFFTSMFKNKLFKSTGVYMGASILNALIPFFMMPILTRYLTPVDYGVISMFSVAVSFVAPFTGLSVHGAIYRQYFELSREEIKIYVANSLFVLLFSSFFVWVMFVGFSEELALFIGIPVNWLGVVIVVSLMNFISQVYLAILQVETKAFSFGLFQVSRSLLNLILSIAFVVVLSLSWRGRLLGILLSAIASGLMALWLLYRFDWITFKFNIQYIKNALNFGVPMIPTALKNTVMAIVDKLFITNMVDIGATGLYSVGFQLSMAISILSSSFNSAYVPWLFKKLKYHDKDINKKIVKMTYIYFFSILLIALSWSFIANKILVLFLGTEFHGASSYIVWLSMGFAFSGMHSMVVNYIYFSQKTARYGVLSIVSVFVNVSLNYLLISRNGPIGAAQATCITYLVTFLMTWALSSKVHRMPWLYFLKGDYR